VLFTFRKKVFSKLIPIGQGNGGGGLKFNPIPLLDEFI
jgi:hypothetical protein